MGSLPPYLLGRRSQYAMLLSLLLAGSMWFYVRRVLIPHQVAEAAALNRPRGILSDLYPRWRGARELLLHHRDPYSAEVTRDIQTGYYGRPLDPTRPNDPTDQQGFAYPVYVVFLLAPTIKLPFTIVEPLFRWLLVGLMVVTVWAWLRFLRWRLSPATGIAVLALTLGSFAVAQAILLEQLTVVVSALVAGCLVALLSSHFLLAGFLLSIATIKPQLVWPIATWLSLWALSDWRKRQGFLWGFGFAAALVLGGELILPGWIGRFRTAVSAYRQYTGTQSIFEKLTTPTLGTIVNLLILLALAFVCWRSRRATPESARFAMTSSLILAATVVLVSSLAPYNQILLLPAVLMLLRNWKERWNADPFTRAASLIGATFVLWPWASALALLLVSPFVPPEALQTAWAVPLFSSLAIPPCILGLFAIHVRRHSGKLEV